MDSQEEEYVEKQYKVVIVGEPSTGKSCIVSRLCQNDFNRQYYPTYGIDFILHRHEIRSGKNVTLVIWDVSGASLKSPLLEHYLYAANIIFVVFDITNSASFSKAVEWLYCVKKMETGTVPTIALIANKIDMEHQRSVSVEKQVKLANDHAITSHSLSARTGENVKLTLQKVCADKLGLKLTRVEQEASQTVVRAEIVAPSQGQMYPTYHPTPSTICNVM